LVARKLPLSFLITVAYDLPFQSNRLTGGPDWVRSARFDVDATPEEGSIPPEASAKAREDAVRVMLQNLLADRFQLVLRRESKEQPVYAVTIKTGGHKLTKAAVEEKDCSDHPKGADDPARCHSFDGGLGRGLHGSAVTIADMATTVSNWAD